MRSRIKHQNTLRVSVIVTTYNRSEHLRRCTAALFTQTRRPDEVVIADDGSNQENVRIIDEIIRTFRLNFVYARQEHNDFRAAANRNNGARHASGDYLVFLDGDVVLLPDALEQHLAVAKPNLWVTGNAVRLADEETKELTPDIILANQLEAFWCKIDRTRRNKMRREARRFKKRAFIARFWNSEKRMRRILLASGNSSMNAETFRAVNGFDEHFIGWGWEDKDLGLRLQLAGFRGKTVADTARSLHLYHPPEIGGTDREKDYTRNREYYLRARKGEFRCQNGMDQHAC